MNSKIWLKKGFEIPKKNGEDAAEREYGQRCKSTM